VLRGDTVLYDENEINVGADFAVIPYLELFTRFANVQTPEKLSLEEWREVAERLKVEYAPEDGIDKVMDQIYKKTARLQLIQPTFIVDYPATYLPLAKRFPDRYQLVDAFQLVMGGVELVKAFSELNDPIDQAERFAEQDKIIAAGDAEGQPSDEDFVEALEYGMPPAGGVGIGLDRLSMILTDTKNIKEVIYFPTMRPKETK